MRLRKITHVLFVIIMMFVFSSCKKECKHVSSDWIVDATETCTKKGSKHKECAKCHEILATEEIPVLGHKYNKNGICTRCGDVLKQAELEFEMGPEYTYYIVTGIDHDENDKSNLAIIIPKEYKGYPVVAIKNEAFKKETRIKSVNISDNISVIGYEAFSCCTGLKNIELPESVVVIGENAFSECRNLTSIKLSKNVELIGIGAFSGCTGLTSMTVDEKNPIFDSRLDCNAIIETKSNKLISGCKNTKIPDSVTSIESYAFSKCYSLTDLVIPNSVTSIKSYAFNECTGLTSVEIPNSINYIESYVFYKCENLKSVVIPDSVTVIGSYAFSECKSLINIEIPTSIDTIRNYAFEGCTSLTSIVIPINVGYMGSYVFNNCTNLTVYCVAPGKPDKWDDDWGGNVNKIVWYYKNSK